MMRSRFGKIVIALAVLGLVAMPVPAMGQSKGDSKPKAAKTQKKDKKSDAKSKKPAKSSKDSEGGKAGKSDKKTSGDSKSKFEHLSQTLAKGLGLSPTEKKAVDDIIAAHVKAVERAAKAKDAFDAKHGAKAKLLHQQLVAARSSKNAAQIKALTAKSEEFKALKTKEVGAYRAPKNSELAAKLAKAVKPDRAEKLNKLLVELKFLPNKNAGASLTVKDFGKAVMSKSVGLTDKQKEHVKRMLKVGSAEIKTAAKAKNRAKVDQAKLKMRGQIKSALKEAQWNSALESLAQTEKKLRKGAEEKAAKAKKSGKADKKPPSKDDKSKKSKKKGKDKKGGGAR